ncbi:MAG: hypothetical protein EOR12_26215 [Mesorhizobium sp.]|uniref:zinc-binding dehydrogenase n=1 Tax=Mesorhizobium sp. TaxID=1871066 RepID=UPI000FE9786D|nr:zinc-binding dehydrogenase [Mesorhizobium sp.]RWP85329.1 MAG: hypothetical protein EOR12_26215 [Mesorhizobium sp.]
MIIGVDLNNDKKEWGERFGMTDFVNPKEIDGDIVPLSRQHDQARRRPDRWRDYTFDCTGSTKVMRQALEAAHRGWGKSVIIGVAGAGQEISTRSFQLVNGRTWMGTAFGGARGRTDVPKNAANGGGRDADLMGDVLAGPTLPPQRHDALGD